MRSVALVSVASMAVMVVATVMVVADFDFVDSVAMTMVMIVMALGEAGVSLEAWVGYPVQRVVRGRRSGRSVRKKPG